MALPNFEVETQLITEGYRSVAGVDEVGRGCIAGPVTAAAVILDPKNIPNGLNDSKKLSLKQRKKAFSEIQEKCVFFVAHSTVSEIDQINILQASLLAMERAIALLWPFPCLLYTSPSPRDRTRSRMPSSA